MKNLQFFTYKKRRVYCHLEHLFLTLKLFLRKSNEMVHLFNWIKMKQSVQNPLTIRQEIIGLGRLTQSDTRRIRQCKTLATQLGFSYQLAFVKIRNFFPKQSPLEVEADILYYVAHQLELADSLLNDYEKQRSVIQRHQGKIKQHLELKDFDEAACQLLVQYLQEQSYQTNQLTLLMPKAQCYLKEQHILQPALSTLRRSIGSARDKARAAIEKRLVQHLTVKNKEKLASLLRVDDTRSLLWQIKQPPSIPSTDAMKVLFERLEHIEALGILQLDISWLNQNYKRQLIRQVRYYSVTRIKSMPEERQYAFLICLCHKLYEETIDYIVEMVIKFFDRAEKHATKEINTETQRKRREIKKALEQYRAISEIILNEEITDEKLRETIYAAVSEKKLREQLDNTTSWLEGKYNHVFHLLQDRHNYFRKFFPGFIQRIALCNDGTKSATELLKAVELLKQLNRDHDNKCPEDAPTDFIPKALTSLIIDDEGNIDRHGWETALLQAVRDEIKHGNVSVNKGRFFSPFNQLFMPDKIWQSKREAFFEKAGLPSNWTLDKF